MAKKNNFNVNDLSSWPLLVVLLASCVIAGLIVLLMTRFLVDDVTNDIERQNRKIVKYEKEYADNQKTIVMLPLIKKEVKELELVRDEAKKYLPTEVSMPSLIDNVYLAATDNGIVFDSLTPGEDEETEYYTIKPISLNAKVGYLSMSSFIEQVTTLRRIMNVHSVSFDILEDDEELSNASDKPLSMTAELRTYIFKERPSTEEEK